MPVRWPWYPGQPVLITRNDYQLELFNGDLGIIDWAESGVLRAFFPGAASDVRQIAPARLPAHETAFAMTVHKSQGSEFDHVLLVLPEKPSPVLTRELLYTAVTRARQSVTICGCKDVIQAAIKTSVRRSSGLAEMIADNSLIFPSTDKPPMCSGL